MSTKHRKGKPYIRRASPKDRSHDLRTALRMAFLSEFYGDYYVLVQHGFRNQVMAAGRTKAAIKESLLPVGAGWMAFREWQNRIHRKTGFGKYRQEG